MSRRRPTDVSGILSSTPHHATCLFTFTTINDSQNDIASQYSRCLPPRDCSTASVEHVIEFRSEG